LDTERARSNDTFFSALRHPARRLTNLEKILTALAVILLLIASTFIGLFAGAEHALKKEKHRGGVTTTITATPTHGHSATGTTSASSTAHPGPTGKPSDVGPAPISNPMQTWLFKIGLTSRTSASQKNACCSPRRSFNRSIPLPTLATTSTSMPVSSALVLPGSMC
jgi:hypothetical protein